MNRKEKIRKIVIFGLIYGLSMFVILDVMVPISQEEILRFKPALLGLLFWIGVGMVVSYIIVLIEESSKKK